MVRIVLCSIAGMIILLASLLFVVDQTVGLYTEIHTTLGIVGYWIAGFVSTFVGGVVGVTVGTEWNKRVDRHGR